VPVDLNEGPHIYHIHLNGSARCGIGQRPAGQASQSDSARGEVLTLVPHPVGTGRTGARSPSQSATVTLRKRGVLAVLSGMRQTEVARTVPEKMLNNAARTDALWGQWPKDNAEIVVELRAYFRSTGLRPGVVRSYFQERHARWAA